MRVLKLEPVDPDREFLKALVTEGSEWIALVGKRRTDPLVHTAPALIVTRQMGEEATPPTSGSSEPKTTRPKPCISYAVMHMTQGSRVV